MKHHQPTYSFGNEEISSSRKNRCFIEYIEKNAILT